MNEFRIFPRLETGRAIESRVRLLESPRPTDQVFSDDMLESAFEAPNVFPATGGKRVSLDELLELRSTCQDETSLLDGLRTRDFGARFDLRIGGALYRATSPSRGEMGNPRVWDFLTLVLLPDLALKRFSADSKDARTRLTGGHRRHVFQRLWKRWQVFGEELVLSSELTEDDYGVLLERNFTLARRRVARRAATQIIQADVARSERRDYARILTRQLQQTSGVVVIGDDDESHLDRLFEHLHSTALNALENKRSRERHLVPTSGTGYQNSWEVTGGTKPKSR